MRRSIVVLSVLSGLLFAIPAAPAFAYSASGKVTHVADGDTIDVDITGDGKGSIRIRIAGLQAMEIHDPNRTSDDECHAAEAMSRMKSLVLNKTVDLSAKSTSSSSAGRPVRFVTVGGVDVTRRMLRGGYAIPWQSGQEDSRQVTYVKDSQYAASNKWRIWNETACASGPSQTAGIASRVQWDAPGDDYLNVNGEYVRVYNRSSYRVSITGWEVRDSSHSSFYFPSASIGPDSYVTVYLGEGTATATKFFWGLTKPLFTNTIPDGGFVLDRDGDIRTHDFYAP